MTNKMHQKPARLCSLFFIFWMAVIPAAAQQNQRARSLQMKLGLEGGMSFISPDDVNRTIAAITDFIRRFSGYIVF